MRVLRVKLCGMFAPYLVHWLAITGLYVKAWQSNFDVRTPRKLPNIRQKWEYNDEFGEKLRRLVTRAYSGTDLDMQDQLAVEAFLRDNHNSRIAYDVYNELQGH